MYKKCILSLYYILKGITFMTSLLLNVTFMLQVGVTTELIITL